MDIQHQQVSSNGIEIHVASCGEGPLVMMLHGFPGLWYSWRKQLPVIAAAGYRAVAIDTRGYGRSTRTTTLSDYSSTNLVADVLGVLDALGEAQAIFIGQDFGARLTWNLASREPERVKAAVVFGVPYDFNRAGQEEGDEALELSGAADIAPSEQFAAVAKEHFYHMHYFQEVGPAEQELCPRARDLLLRLYWALSAEGNLLDWRNHPSEGTGYLDVLEAPSRDLPWSWFSEEDLDYLVSEFSSAGESLTFMGGLSAYRVQDINWRIAKEYQNLTVNAPVLYISGEKDSVNAMMPANAMAHMRSLVPNLVGEEEVAGAGHFVMQEQSDAVNKLLLKFLADHGRSGSA